MTPRQAAERIGCSPQQVRTLIRNGTLRATKVKNPYGVGYYYQVNTSDVRRYRNRKQTVGYPRGRPRS